MQQESTITLEQLIKNGWVETGDPIYPIQKTLTDTESDDYDPEDGDICLVLHRMMNVNMFALSLPDGGLVNLNPSKIEDLLFIETMILGYMPNY